MARFYAIVAQDFLAEKILRAWEEYEEGNSAVDAEFQRTGDPKQDVVNHAYAIPWKFLTKQLEMDISAVDFDFENCSADTVFATLDDLKVPLGFQTLDNLTFLGINAGGDWEVPVFFIVYWDGMELRAYIPTEGNTWNLTAHSAFGNDEDQDVDELKRRFPKETDGLHPEEISDMVAVVNPDPSKLVEDIKANLSNNEVKPDGPQIV
jgi:hypothetical protein